MSDFKDDYIKYRISKCKEALADAKLLSEQARWNASINRLYYSCYYIVSAPHHGERFHLAYKIQNKPKSGVRI
jgi:uncharacterized protein (UPF0332 family)